MDTPTPTLTANQSALQANSGIAAGNAGSPWTLAPSTTAVQNKSPQTYPVVSADLAKQDLATKNNNFNKIVGGMQDQQLANITNNSTKQAADQNKATLDATTKPSKTLDEIKNMVSGGTTKSSTTASLEDINAKADAAYTDYKSQVDQLRSGAFPLTPDQNAQVSYIQQQYDRLRQTQLTANKNYEASMAQLGDTSGRSRYAPEIQTGLMQQAVTDGITKLSDIESKAANDVATLRQGFQDKNYQIINDSYKALTDSLTQKGNIINQIATNVREEANSALAQHAQTYKEQQDAIQHQQDAIKFATDNNITKPAYLVGNTAINTQTGEPMTFQDYLKLTGQDPNTPEDQADWSFLQTDIQTPAEQSLQQNQSQFEQNQALEYTKLAQNQAQFEQTLAQKTGLPGDATLGDYVETDNNGNQYINYDKLTTAEKSAVGSLARQAGIPILKQGDVSKLNAIQDTRENLAAIMDSVNQINLGSAGSLGHPSFVEGINNSVNKFLGDTNLKSYNAYRTAIINSVQALAGGAGSGLRINKAEIDAAMENDLPVVTGVHADTQASAAAKIAKLNAQLDNWEKILVGSSPANAGGGQIIEYNGQHYQADTKGNFDENSPIGSNPLNSKQASGSGGLTFNQVGNTTASNGNQVKGIQVKAQPMPYLSVSSKPNAPKVSLTQAFPAGSSGGECGVWVRDIVEKQGLTYPPVGNSLSEKANVAKKYGVPVTQGKAGSVIITGENKTNGHVAYALAKTAAGYIVAESNFGLNGKVSYGRLIPFNKIIGVLNPKKA